MIADLITTESSHEEKLKWEKRHVDPMIKSRWNAEIQVIPAGDSGIGFRIFPDGQREQFERSAK